MKKMLLLLVLTAVAITLSALTTTAYAGAAFNMVTTDIPDASPESAIGFHAGAGVDIPMGSMILEPGLRFVTRGYGQTIKYGNIERDYTYGLNYLDIFAKLKFPMGSFIPFVGVAPSLKMSESVELDGTEVTLPWDNYESFNTFVLAGADFIVAEQFVVGLEFNYGVMNLLTADSRKVGNEEYSANAMSILLNLGYKFNF